MGSRERSGSLWRVRAWLRTTVTLARSCAGCGRGVAWLIAGGEKLSGYEVKIAFGS